jgi:hypothetical protein
MTTLQDQIVSSGCTYCEHPQAKPEPWEVVYITGSVTSISCAACAIEGRGTLGCPIHVHYCSVHRAAPELLSALKAIAEAWNSPLEKRALKYAHLEVAKAAIAKAEGRE